MQSLKKLISVGILLPGLTIGAIGMSGLFAAQALVANAAGPWFVSPAGNDTNDCLSAVTACLTIQAAVDKSAPGDMITVAAGTYAEHVSISHSVTIDGANSGIAGYNVRGPESIVDGSDTGTPFVITANGVSINGFTVENGSNGGFFSGIWSQTGTQNSSVLDNIITQNGIGVWAQCGGNCMIQNNLFDGNNKPGPSGGAGISADSTTGLTINGNELKNHTENNPILFQAAVANAHQNDVVSNNNIHDNLNGGSAIYALALASSSFTGNLISADTSDIRLGGGNHGVTITGNTLHSTVGVNVVDDGFGLGLNTGVQVNRNSLTGHSVAGVDNSQPGQALSVDATCNWWGAANGPGPVGTGSGDPVSANVSFSPWLTTSNLATDPCGGVATAPVISNVSIKSNSAKGPTKATLGDIITLTFTTDQPVTKLGNFKINSSNPDTFTNVGNNYTATHLVDAGDPITGVSSTFQINVKSAAGIFSQTIEATNDGSSVTIVDPKPVISNVSIKSNNANPSIAKNGDIITLTFTTDEPVTKLGNFKINSSNPDTFTNVGNNYTATHLVDAGDPITGVSSTFQINVKNANGIFSQTIEATNDGSSVTIISAVTLEAEDFGVVSFDTGLGFLKGYTAGFGLHGGPTFASSSVVMQLFASSTLLQTNSSTLKVGNTITGTQISSPFDVSGNFDYVADGFWVNTRQPEFGQTLSATRVVATVTLADGTVLTAENDILAGDPATIKPSATLVVQKMALGGNNTFSFTGDNGLGAFQIMTLPTSTKVVNSSGTATFSVAPGTYHVSEATTTGWTLVSNGCSEVVVAATGTTTCTVTNAKLGEIKGTKFEDRNGNGANVKNDDGDNSGKDGDNSGKNDGDNSGKGNNNNNDEDNNDNNRPVAGVMIFLDANNNGILDPGEVATTTDKNGNYDFMGLIPGLYHVREVVQPGWMQTAPTGGVFNITLAPGQVSKKNDFMNFRLGSISGMKFNDLNGNGKNDTNAKKGVLEPGLSGWTIMLTAPSGTTSTMVTDNAGNYSFSNLGPGTYKLAEVMQAGWTQTLHPDSVKIQSGTVSTGDDFGNHLGSVVTKGKGQN